MQSVDTKLKEIHSKLTLIHGSMEEELPEQKMAASFLIGTEKVLEIGGNVGRNSLVIASILGENQKNLVVLECDPASASKLKENRDANNFFFSIESSALSKRKLIQQGWTTVYIENNSSIPEGFTEVNTISYAELKEKYKISFDTLVLDCEGAFYTILKDMPEVLADINLILVENDYHDYKEKQYVDFILRKHGFEVIYSEAGGWGCCSENFYEAWRRT